MFKLFYEKSLWVLARSQQVGISLLLSLPQPLSQDVIASSSFSSPLSPGHMLPSGIEETECAGNRWSLTLVPQTHWLNLKEADVKDELTNSLTQRLCIEFHQIWSTILRTVLYLMYLTQD